MRQGGNGKDVGSSIYVDSINNKIHVTGCSYNDSDSDMVIWGYK